jgi:hypothetical protein
MRPEPVQRSSAWWYATFLALGCADGGGRTPDASPPTDAGHPDAAPALCDGELDWRLVALTVPPSPRLEPGSQVVYENGALLILVRGDCELWVSGETPGELRHAMLMPSHASLLARDVQHASWHNYAGTWIGEAFDGPTLVLHDGMAWTVCHQLCVGARLPEELARIRPALEESLPGLRAAATPVSGPVRFMAVQVTPGNEPVGREPFLWNFESPLAEVSLTEGEAIAAPYGSGIVLEDLERADRLRRAWREAQRGGHSYLAVIDPGGRWYRVYLRDVLPFEDPSGLIFAEHR